MFCSRPVAPDVSKSDSAVRVTFRTSERFSVLSLSLSARVRLGDGSDACWQSARSYYTLKHVVKLFLDMFIRSLTISTYKIKLKEVDNNRAIEFFVIIVTVVR